MNNDSPGVSDSGVFLFIFYRNAGFVTEIIDFCTKV